MGEGPMLKDEEWPLLLRTVVQAAKDRASIVCGLHYKDTKRTIEDAKIAQDMGAIGLQICPPIFNLPSQDDLIDYYQDISDNIDIGIMVYCTQWMPGGLVEVDTIMRMEDIPQVVSIKWSPPPDGKQEDMAKFAHIFSVIENGGSPAESHKMGGRGYINLTAEAYPPHDLEIWDHMESGRYDEAQTIWDKVNNPLRDYSAKVDERSGGQGRVKKGLSYLMGKPAGASRPPSKPLNEEELDELREILVGYGWPVVN
jgi:4-hydroxy-tetrahydrodipicolinate synthase